MLAWLVTMLVGTASFTSEANLLLLLFGISTGLFAFSLVACMRTVRRLDVDRHLGAATVAGRPFRLAYTVRNRRQWMGCRSIRIAEAPVGGEGAAFPSAFLAMLPARAEARLELSAMCPRRGRVALRAIRVSSGFPFGLFTCSVDIEAPAELLIYPALGRIRRDLWRQPAAVGPASRRADRSSGHDEFHGVREYRQGDNPRWIHWRRSARTGQLVVREHIEVRDSQLIVLVDPWPTPPRPENTRRRAPAVRAGSAADIEARVERIVSAAATAACDALDRGHRVGLVCRAAVPIILAPAGGRPHRQRILNELALLTCGEASSMQELIAGIRWSTGWNARCLLFATQVYESHQQVARLLAARSEGVMTISPQSAWLDKCFDNLPAVAESRSTA